MQKYRRFICSPCWNTRQRGYQRNNPNHRDEQRERRKKREASWSDERRQIESDKKRAKYFKKTYGITMEDYELKLSRQNGLCGICKTDKPGGRGNFHVDHCHKTGVVRGLLCMACNIALGKFKDDILVMKRAIQYLENNGGLN